MSAILAAVNWSRADRIAGSRGAAKAPSNITFNPAEDEPARWVESIGVDQDQPESAHQVWALERRQRGIGFGHEERIAGRQRGDQLRIEREIVGFDVQMGAGCATRGDYQMSDKPKFGDPSYNIVWDNLSWKETPRTIVIGLAGLIPDVGGAFSKALSMIWPDPKSAQALIEESDKKMKAWVSLEIETQIAKYDTEKL